MALIRCPECGKEISDKAPACIHCGHPTHKKEEHTIPCGELKFSTISDNEYLSLREEILHGYTIVDSSRNILYLAVAYILTFTTDKSIPMLYLLPFAVIIPIYLIAINYTYDMYRISTYMIVFGENPNSSYKWESRQLVLNKQKDHSIPRQAKMFHVPYISLGTACIVLFVLTLDYQAFSLSSAFWLIIGITLYIILILIFKHYGDMLSVQQKYLEGWLSVKNKETHDVNQIFYNFPSKH